MLKMNEISSGIKPEIIFNEMKESTEEHPLLERDKEKNESSRKRRISTNKKMKKFKKTQRKSKSPRKGSKKNLDVKRNQPKRKVKASRNNSTSQARSVSKSRPSAKDKNKKTKDTSGSRKSKCAKNLKKSDELHLKENGAIKMLENGWPGLDEDGPFSETCEDEISFIAPMPFLTTDDLLDSVKTTVMNGRYTPPTSVFDKVYGNKSPNDLTERILSDDIVVRNNCVNHVVKRMSKIKNKSKAKHNVHSKGDKKTYEIPRASKANTDTSVSIIKELLSQEKPDDVVDISD